VETEGQSQLLMSLGCNEAQGYLFGRPMPGAEFKAYGAARIAGRQRTLEPLLHG
jgi:EAL domain-containing protein (putative c-di-GMP-specific phosphodiesterase class I)